MPVTVRILTSKKERLYIIDEGAVGEIKKRQVLSLLIIFCCKHPKRNCLKGQNALALLEGCLYFALPDDHKQARTKKNPAILPGFRSPCWT